MQTAPVLGSGSRYRSCHPPYGIQVGRDTVLHALSLLRDSGLIFTVPKRGSYVSQPR